MERTDCWFITKGFSPVQKQSVLLTETPPQLNLLFPAGAALKYPPNPPPSPLFSSSLHLTLPLLCKSVPKAPPLLHPSLPSPALWAASSLRQTAPFMKSVTWAGLQRPDDAVAHPLTAQVLRELEEFPTVSSLRLPLSLGFLQFFFF